MILVDHDNDANQWPFKTEKKEKRNKRSERWGNTDWIMEHGVLVGFGQSGYQWGK